MKKAARNSDSECKNTHPTKKFVVVTWRPQNWFISTFSSKVLCFSSPLAFAVHHLDDQDFVDLKNVAFNILHILPNRTLNHP